MKWLIKFNVKQISNIFYEFNSNYLQNIEINKYNLQELISISIILLTRMFVTNITL